VDTRRKKFRLGFGAIIAITVIAFSLGVAAGKKERVSQNKKINGERVGQGIEQI
jgi:hypothetical protein